MLRSFEEASNSLRSTRDTHSPMMPNNDLMSEEIREAVEKIVRRHLSDGVHFDQFPRPFIEYYGDKIRIFLDAKATVLSEKVIELDRRRQFLEIRFLEPISAASQTSR